MALNKIKLCFIFDDFKIGGTQKLMMDVISLLNKNKFDIRIRILDSNCDNNHIKLQNEEIDMKYLGIKNSVNIISNLSIIYNEILNYDIIVTFSSDSNFYCSIIKKILPKVGKFICFTHGIDGFYIKDEYYDKVKYKLGILYKIKEKYILNHLLKYYDRFITVCNSLNSYLVEIRNVKQESIRTIYLGLIVDKYNSVNYFSDYERIRNILKINMDDFVIIYSGRLSYAKGLENLIKTFSSFNKINEKSKLIILGNGELKDYLVSEVSKYCLEDYCKFIEFNDNYLYYVSAADLFLLPSKSESTNLGVQEAMLLKKLVLSSDAGGMKELINHGENGFLFRNGDYDDMLSKMEYIYKYRNELAQIKNMAEKEIINKFNLSDNIKAVEEVFVKTYEEH